MQKMMFTVVDTLVNKAYPPFLAVNIAEAKRNIVTDLSSKPDALVGQQFADKKCFVTGTFFEDTGRIEALPNPELAFEMSSLVPMVYAGVREHMNQLHPQKEGVK